MFDDALMKEEMLAIGYMRRRKFIYQASWGSQYIEHFIYFREDSRQYFVARFGLRNPIAEEFSIGSYIKYGHPNLQLIRQNRDPKTACSMSFEFDRINETSQTSWPRIHIPEMTSSELAVFVGRFIKLHIFPFTKHVVDLPTFLTLLIADREPTPWFASGHAIRAAQLTATASQLGLGRTEIRGLLKPHDKFISVALFEKQLDPESCVDRYLDRLILDWTQRLSP
jgi:hypothetical protein